MKAIKRANQIELAARDAERTGVEAMREASLCIKSMRRVDGGRELKRRVDTALDGLKTVRREPRYNRSDVTLARGCLISNMSGSIGLPSISLACIHLNYLSAN